MENLGRILLLLGAIITAIGILTLLLSRIPFLRNLGGLRIELGPVTCFFPIVASIVLSIVLTIILNFVLWIANR